MSDANAINGASSDWLAITRNACKDGEQYFNSGIRREMEEDVRQFQGRHPLGSRYASEHYQGRAHYFAPKTRATIRKNEAVAANAYFSNTDVVEISAWDDSDHMQEGSAKLLKELLALRLKRSIPWFMLTMGAYQETQVTGQCCAHVYWETDKSKGVDRPRIDLVPIENMIFAPNTPWFDPVNQAAYMIHKIPMYVKDVRARMSMVPGKTDVGKWAKLDDSIILQAVHNWSDSIRLEREFRRADSQAQATSLTDYQMVWVYRTIADIDGVDYMWYSLAETELLTKGKPLVNSFWHGLRPYVLGFAILEAHKIFPPGVSRVTREIQRMINNLVNQRHDNVAFAMNKRYFAKRNAQVDIKSLTRNIPGSVTLMNKVEGPDADVHVVETKDVTQSAFEEQDRYNIDFDEIAGSVSKASRGDPNDLANKVGGAEMLTEDANQIQGYQLRTFTETWTEPVLYQLMRLEQHYETDEDVLALAAKKADLDKLGIDQVDDVLLMQDLALTVHVGIGATSPRKQLENLLYGLTQIRTLLEGNVLQQINLDLQAVLDEIFGKLGYKDSDRFFRWNDQDPNIVALQNQVQDLTTALQNKKDPPEITQQKVALLQAQVKKTLSDAFNVNVEGLFGSMQAAEVVAAVPAVAPVADTIAKAAGYEPPAPPGQNPDIQSAGAAPAQPPGTAPAQQPPQGMAPAGGPVPPAPPMGSGPAAGLAINPKGVADRLHTTDTGVTFKPGGGVPAPPQGEKNTHPLHPDKPESGAHAGVDGGNDKHTQLLEAMAKTHQALAEHVMAPKKMPKINIKRDAQGNAVSFEPEEQK